MSQKFTILGDVHGDVTICHTVCAANKDRIIIQIGDFGVGWIDYNALRKFPRVSPNFRFFPGNHDNRSMCNKLPYCLGDYGSIFDDSMFFVSGARSIDQNERIEGISWWPNEELSYKQGLDCLDKWEKSKAKILLSHDIPQSFAESYMLTYDRDQTRNLLQRMIEIRKPEIIFAGHWHKKLRVQKDNILLHVLEINEYVNFNI